MRASSRKNGASVGQKFPKSSAQLNGVPGGQGGVETSEVERRPQVGHGGIGKALLRLPWELLASVGVSGGSSDLRDDCLPRAACPGKQGLGIRYIQLLELPGPRFSPAAELQEVWGWPQLEEGETLGFSPSDGLSLESRFSGLEEAGLLQKRRLKPS